MMESAISLATLDGFRASFQQVEEPGEGLARQNMEDAGPRRSCTRVLFRSPRLPVPGTRKHVHLTTQTLRCDYGHEHSSLVADGDTSPGPCETCCLAKLCSRDTMREPSANGVRVEHRRRKAA
jgi:hypothetical protein